LGRKKIPKAALFDKNRIFGRKKEHRHRWSTEFSFRNEEITKDPKGVSSELRRYVTAGALIVAALVGAIVGSFIGDLLTPYVEFLGKSIDLGISPPFVARLSVFNLTFGFEIHLNLLGAVGAALGIWFMAKRT